MDAAVRVHRAGVGRRAAAAARPRNATSPTAASRLSLFLALKLQRPLFLEGEAGVGKTEIAKVLAAALGTELIRLQCYEGLDVSHAVYEWNYPRQLLEIRLREARGELDRRGGRRPSSSTERFLIKRPLLQALERRTDRRPCC